jgi:hypothetical protein
MPYAAEGHSSEAVVGQLDPPSLAVQNVGVLIGSPLFIAGN